MRPAPLRSRLAEIAGLTDESVCPTLGRKRLRFCGAGAFARRFRLPTDSFTAFKGADGLVELRRFDGRLDRVGEFRRVDLSGSLKPVAAHIVDAN